MCGLTIRPKFLRTIETTNEVNIFPWPLERKVAYLNRDSGAASDILSAPLSPVDPLPTPFVVVPGVFHNASSGRLRICIWADAPASGWLS